MPAETNFTVGVIQAADEKKASIAAAITSITAEPNTMTLVSRAAADNAVTRLARPGSNTARPSLRPAAPQKTNVP